MVEVPPEINGHTGGGVTRDDGFGCTDLPQGMIGGVSVYDPKQIGSDGNCRQGFPFWPEAGRRPAHEIQCPLDPIRIGRLPGNQTVQRDHSGIGVGVEKWIVTRHGMLPGKSRISGRKDWTDRRKLPYRFDRITKRIYILYHVKRRLANRDFADRQERVDD
jgi:hypothetical protein